MKKSLLVFCVVALAVSAFASSHPNVGPGGARYATDAYPGFDDDAANRKPERKMPHWFAWLTGPKRDNAKDQLAWCVDEIKSESWSSAAKGLDALVRAWPSAPEAAKAQKALADVQYGHFRDYERAFAEYRYLLDFYSLQCNYDQIVARLYEIAGKMREEGKTIVFFRFANTVDVRRAYEAAVLRAPGAAFVPDAMLTIAELREEDEEYEEAIAVYENLRNLRPGTAEAFTALRREAKARLEVLRAFGYNRDRCRDTENFLKLAIANDPAGADELKPLLAEVTDHIEDEAYASAKFYDSRTRTVRSAINAYETFVRDYPASRHVAEAQARLEELKGKEQ